MSEMTRRSSADVARRTTISISRGTVEKVHDDKKLQEVDITMYHTERKTNVERAQQYGFTGVPLPPSGKEKAEAFVIFPNGTRSHGVVIGIDDRRHRPKNLKPGEVALYDDQGQQVHITRDKIHIKGGASKKPVHVETGGALAKFEDGKITLQLGGCKLEITSAGFAFTGGEITHDGKKIDKTHKHTGTQPGAGTTGVPE